MKYLIIYFSVFLVAINGCQSDHACASYQSYIESKSCSLVLLKQNEFGREYTAEGYDPNTKNKIIFEDVGGLYIQLREAIASGDTLLKPKGKPYFLVKKRRFDIKFEIKCNGTTPLPSPADTIPKSGV